MPSRPDPFFTYRNDANEPDDGDRAAPDRHFFADRIDGAESHDPAPSLHVAYNGRSEPVEIRLLAPMIGRAWLCAGDTAAWIEGRGNFEEPGSIDRLGSRDSEMQERSILVLMIRGSTGTSRTRSSGRRGTSSGR